MTAREEHALQQRILKGHHIFLTILRIILRVLLTAGILAILIPIVRSNWRIAEKVIVGAFVVLPVLIMVATFFEAGLPGFEQDRAGFAKSTGDQALLNNMARFDDCPDVRLEAARRIKNEALLTDLARLDRDASVRCEAAARVSNSFCASILLSTCPDVMAVRQCVFNLQKTYLCGYCLPGSLGESLKENEYIQEDMATPICPDCFGDIRAKLKKKQIENYDSAESNGKESDQPYCIRYVCEKCGRESAADFSIQLSYFIPKEGQAKES